MQYYQLIIFSVEATITAMLLLSLFRLRFHLGMIPLYITLGVFQPIQVFLASSFYVEILPGIIVSPGSVVLFTSSLFVVLLVYVQEDVVAARKAIYGIMLANIAMSLLLYIFGMHLAFPGTQNLLGISRELFSQSARVMLTGTVVLFADIVLIIFVYELIGRWVKILLLRIYLAMGAILVFDSLGFCTGAFWGHLNYSSILFSGIIGKLIMAIFFAATLTIYLKFCEPKTDRAKSLVDIFNVLTYRQKYEVERQRVISLELRFSSTFEQAAVGIAHIGIDGSWLCVNKTLCSIVGYTEEELLNITFQDITHPDDLENDLDNVKLLLAGKTKMYSTEKRYFHKNGSIVWVKLTVSLVRDQKNKPVYFISVIENITEQKKTELSLLRNKCIIDNSRDMMAMMDKEYRYLEVNDAYINAFGFKITDFIDKTVAEVFGNDFFETVIKPYADKCLSGEDVFYEDWFDFPVTGRKWMSIGYFKFHDFEEKVTGFIVSTRDNTEHKLEELEKAKMLKQFNQIQKIDAVGRLAGGIAHDFNNMLSVILGYGELLLAEFHHEDSVHKKITEIVNAAQRSAALTQQLLSYSRQQKLAPVIVNINRILNEFKKMLQRLLGEDIELKLILSDDLDCVEVDIGQFEQVIMNISINARDSMIKGGELVIKTENVNIDVSFSKLHDSLVPGKYVLVSIIDIGEGIPKEIVEKIFDPFFTTKEKGKGTGLGLSTTYGIIRQSKGAILCYSELGIGTTFKIYLPVTDSKSVKQTKKTEKRKKVGNGEHILLVEDEPSIRELIVTFLSAFDYKVTVAANGGEALRLIEEEKLNPDLLITDVVMPVMSGIELVKRIIKNQSDLKVLYMSGYNEENMARHGEVQNNENFIEKPFNVNVFSNKVYDILHKNIDESE